MMRSSVDRALFSGGRSRGSNSPFILLLTPYLLTKQLYLHRLIEGAALKSNSY